MEHEKFAITSTTKDENLILGRNPVLLYYMDSTLDLHFPDALKTTRTPLFILIKNIIRNTVPEVHLGQGWRNTFTKTLYPYKLLAQVNWLCIHSLPSGVGFPCVFSNLIPEQLSDTVFHCLNISKVLSVFAWCHSIHVGIPKQRNCHNIGVQGLHVNPWEMNSV